MENDSKKAVKKLNQTQLAHGLNRLQSIYTQKTRNVNVGTGVGRVVDWTNTKSVEAFVKKHKLPEVGWKELGGYLYAGHSLPSGVRTKVDAALNEEAAERQKEISRLQQQATAALATAQDQLIFQKMTAEDIPAFLTGFESSLNDLIS